MIYAKLFEEIHLFRSKSADLGRVLDGLAEWFYSSLVNGIGHVSFAICRFQSQLGSGTNQLVPILFQFCLEVYASFSAIIFQIYHKDSSMQGIFCFEMVLFRNEE